MLSASMGITHNLYAAPDIYDKVFPLDSAEVRFWRELLGGGDGAVLDLGAGSCDLVYQLGFQLPVALDPDALLLSGASEHKRGLRASALAIPLRSSSCGAVFSRLFSVSYAVARKPDEFLPIVAHELRRVAMPGATVALEIPLAWRPSRLQWIEETAPIDEELTYRFRYLELSLRHAKGAVIDTEISVAAGGVQWQLEAPLFVFTPAGAASWAATAGLQEVRFYASYDVGTGTLSPPEDVLRGVLVGRRSS